MTLKHPRVLPALSEFGIFIPSRPYLQTLHLHTIALMTRGSLFKDVQRNTPYVETVL